MLRQVAVRRHAGPGREIHQCGWRIGPRGQPIGQVGGDLGGHGVGALHVLGNPEQQAVKAPDGGALRPQVGADDALGPVAGIAQIGRVSGAVVQAEGGCLSVLNKSQEDAGVFPENPDVFRRRRAIGGFSLRRDAEIDPDN